MKYLVEIIPESITDLQTATLSLAKTLKLDPAKAAALLKRNPVTKPVSQAEAEKVARLFTKAGIEVFIRGEEEASPSVTPSEPSSPRDVSQASISIVTSPTPLEQTNLDDVPVPPKTTPLPEPQHLTPDLTVNLEAHQTNADSDVTTPHVNSTYLSSARLPSVVPEIHQVSSVRSEVEMEHASKQNTLHINTMHGDESLKIPQGFFTPVPETETSASPATNSSVVSTPPRSGNFGKIAFASIVPGLLALAGVLTALYLLGLPFLRSQQRVAAETTAISLANSIGGWIGDVSLANPTLSQQVQSVITRTQGELRTKDIDFVLLSDAEGNQLAGWFKDLPTPGVPETVTNTQEIRNQISNAVGSAVAAQAGTPVGENASPTTLVVEGETLELASAAVRQGTTPVGAVVVGSSQQHLTARLQEPLTMIVLAGALPLLLGILVSFLIGRNRS
jgi:hypothetical protein